MKHEATAHIRVLRHIHETEPISGGDVRLEATRNICMHKNLPIKRPTNGGNVTLDA